MRPFLLLLLFIFCYAYEDTEHIKLVPLGDGYANAKYIKNITMHGNVYVGFGISIDKSMPIAGNSSTYLVAYYDKNTNISFSYDQLKNNAERFKFIYIEPCKKIFSRGESFSIIIDSFGTKLAIDVLYYENNITELTQPGILNALEPANTIIYPGLNHFKAYYMVNGSSNDEDLIVTPSISSINASIESFKVFGNHDCEILLDSKTKNLTQSVVINNRGSSSSYIIAFDVASDSYPVNMTLDYSKTLRSPGTIRHKSLPTWAVSIIALFCAVTSFGVLGYVLYIVKKSRNDKEYNYSPMPLS